MLDMAINPCPFVRTIEGLSGTVLLRRHPAHVTRVVTAIERRTPPAWSAGQGGRTWSPPRTMRRKAVRK